MSKDLTEALRALSQPEGYAAPPAPAPLKTRGGAPAQKSAALNSGKSAGGSSGTVGPFTEADYANRTWYNQRTTQTPDGLFTVAWKPLHVLPLLDGNSQTVTFTFQDAP